MDGCNFDEAFPEGPVGTPGCLDRASAEESRRQEKKKARRCRGPQANYLNKGWNMVGATGADPDMRLDPVPAMNPSTGLMQHHPVTQQYNYEAFVGSMDNLPAIRSDVAGPTSLQKSSFFGASPDDSPSTSLLKRKGVAEPFQGDHESFVDVIGDEETYKLMPDFAKTFGSRGAQKASGGASISGPSPVGQELSYLSPTGILPNSILPTPNLDVFWKENGIAGGQSSFYSHLRTPNTNTGNEIVSEDLPVSRKEVLTKLDRIFARLDDMEAAKSENAQTEVLLFILTGLGVIFLMDVGCRAAATLGRRR